MRLFIGIQLPNTVVRELSDVRSLLEERSDAGRFCRDDQFHVTLRFLGDTPNLLVRTILRSISGVAAGHEPFVLQLSLLGRFGGESDVVCWAGVGGEIAALRRLQADLEHAMQAVGFAPERKPYQPHITLGRSVSIAPEAFPTIQSIPFLVDRCTLFESRREGGNLRYIPIMHHMLGERRA